jgi:hypothetical protein
MSRTKDVLLWGAEKEEALMGSLANVQPSIDGLLANAENLNQVVTISCVQNAGFPQLFLHPMHVCP